MKSLLLALLLVVTACPASPAPSSTESSPSLQTKATRIRLALAYTCGFLHARGGKNPVCDEYRGIALGEGMELTK